MLDNLESAVFMVMGMVALKEVDREAAKMSGKVTKSVYRTEI